MNQVILGLSGTFGHDAAAALLIDGKVVYSVEEERLCRQKRAVGQQPVMSARECLRRSGIPIDEITVVAVSCSGSDDNAARFIEKWSQNLGIKDTPEVAFFDHHLCHAAHAIAVSELTEGITIVVDGHSDRNSVSFGSFQGNRIDLSGNWTIEQSLGHFYEAAAFHLGFGFEGVGKLMGLASYKSTDRDNYGFYEKILKGFHQVPVWDGFTDYRARCRATISFWLRFFSHLFPNVNNSDIFRQPMMPSSKIVESEMYVAFASAIQDILEEKLLTIVEQVMKETGLTSIAYGGGVALNCKANSRLLESLPIDSLVIPPGSGDCGTAIGAALLASGTIPRGVRNPYLGASFDDNYVEWILKRNHIEFRYEEAPEEIIAKLIEDGHIIGRFSGRAEFGPRALGNRSIIARADSPKLRDQINGIKNREWWRPIAPMLTDNQYEARIGRNYHASPYMLQAPCLPESASEILAGGIHVDRTSRVQTVSSSMNEPLCRLLNSLESRFGRCGLLNTSFNSNFEPIVYTPDDAIRSFYSSGLTILQLENFIVSKLQ